MCFTYASNYKVLRLCSFLESLNAAECAQTQTMSEHSNICRDKKYRTEFRREV